MTVIRQHDAEFQVMAPQQAPRSSHSMPPRFIGLVLFALALVVAFRTFGEMRYVSIYNGDDEARSWSYLPSTMNATNATNTRPKTTVAYAVSVTYYKHGETKEYSHLLDRAAVLHQSIKLAMKKSLRYDYHIYAFVHPDAEDAVHLLEELGYRVQVRETPFELSEIPNPELIEAQGNGCCQEKEYLKLFTYLLSDYPVAIHLDLDTIVLRPMDELFDVMTATAGDDEVASFAKAATMWLGNKQNKARSTHASKSVLDNPGDINFMFTRDYNMVDPTDPPWKLPYQMGVQGGFLVIRPNERDFLRMIEVIQTGGEGFDIAHGWGGQKHQYGGYYGAGTIQGLASFYYDYHENATRSVELNRCKYNAMVDHPLHFDEEKKKKLCRTTEKKCEDCRKTRLEDIYTAHFTVCGKPEYCDHMHPFGLCKELLREWHKTRFSLELEWVNRFSFLNDNNKSTSWYVPRLKGVTHKSYQMGHCDGQTYIPMRFPVLSETNSENDGATLI